jgi:cysteine desulfurase / selenocysteine lyase
VNTEPKIPKKIKCGSKALFSTKEYKAYLNFASQSLTPSTASHTLKQWYQTHHTLGSFARPLWQAQRERLRQKIALLLSCQPEDIGFGHSTSHALSDITLMIDWKPDDRVLVFNGDFPSAVISLQNTTRIFDLELIKHDIHLFREHPEKGLEKLENELKKGLRLVVVSHVLFQTGCVMPIKKMADLCHQYGAEIFVDAAQSLGSINIDLTELNIDYLAAPSQKWLMGCEGVGVLYIHPEKSNQLVHRKTGWLSYHQGDKFLSGEPEFLRYDFPAKTNASIIEMATDNEIGIALLETGVSCLLNIGMKKIKQHVQTLHNILEEGLVNQGYTSLRTRHTSGRSSILCFTPPKGIDTVSLKENFLQKKVAISTPDGYLRFSPHWPSTVKEMKKTVRISQQILKSSF